MEKKQLDLSNYRLEKSKEDLESAELVFNSDKFSQSINRSYYSMFHAARALLALEKIDAKSHSGVIKLFNMHYIKTEKIEKEYAKMLAGAFEIRNESDYIDFFVATREEALKQLENAKKFLNRIRTFIKSLDFQVKEKET